MIFDTHVHYNSDRFSEDRMEVLGDIRSAGVDRVTEIGIDLKDTDAMLAMVEEINRANANMQPEPVYPRMYAAIGVHPEYVYTDVDGSAVPHSVPERIRGICSRKNPFIPIVAIGETGLDYHERKRLRSGNQADAVIQKEWFDVQLGLCEELNLPVVIHSRDACKDTLDIVKSHPTVNGVVHCFSYTKETAREYIKRGYFLGIGGALLRENVNKVAEVVKDIPLEYLVTETDSPYMTPAILGRSRNTSATLPYVVEAIAKMKGIAPEITEEKLRQNADRLYRLEP